MIISQTSDSERERLRRSAASGDEGPTDEAQAAGRFPLDRVLRIAGDFNADGSSDPTNVSFPFLRRMRNDHMIAMGLHFIEMDLLKAPWYYESESARAAALADNLIRPIYGRLVRIILRYLWAGYSPGVKRFKFVNPDWVYFENGEAKQVWDKKNIDAAVYRPVLPLKPEHCRPIWKDGNFNGIQYDGLYGGGYFVVDGQKQNEIDLLHSMWATHGQEGEDNSIYGKPRIGHAAPIFHMYWYLWAMMGRAFENNADPGPVMRYPMLDSSPNMTDADGNKVTAVQTALTIGRRKRSGSTIALPSDPYTTFDDRPSTALKWGIEYPEVKTNFEAMANQLGMLEAAKLNAIWIPAEGLQGSSVSGSSSNRNTASEFSDLRDESQFVLMKLVDELIDNVFVRPAFAMNMPEFQGTIQKRTMGLSNNDEDMIRQVFQLVGQQDWRNFGIDVQKLAEARNFPMLDPIERERQLRQVADQAEQAPTPVVEPTQGRRALVTQTGFGETSYMQVDSLSPVKLAEDGDFVAGLPRTDHFSDSAVLGTTRQLRGFAHEYYSALYEDFAHYVSRRKSINFADDDPVDRMMNGWKPRPEKIKKFTARARHALTTIFNRAAALKLKDLVASKTVTDKTDDRAAAWLDEHGAQMVSDITDTVREELQEFMSANVKDGMTPKELAQGIRENFSQWPGWKADRLARTETTTAYNFATLSAGQAAGIKKTQLIDGNDDPVCKKRNGKIMSIQDAFKEDLAHPNCTVYFRLMPQAALSVRREALKEGLKARYDEGSQTILLSPELDAEGETEFMLSLGEDLAQRHVAVEVSASSNGHSTEEVMLTA